MISICNRSQFSSLLVRKCLGTLRYQTPQFSHLNSHTRSITIPTPVMSAPVASASIPDSAPGENFEVRQTHPSEDYAPDPSKSLKLSPTRQALVDDILDLYCCKPTIEKVKRYTPDCTYDDQFVYANDRYKMAGQWFALPKLFSLSTTNKLQIVTDEPGLIQWKYEQVRFMSLCYLVYPLAVESFAFRTACFLYTLPRLTQQDLVMVAATLMRCAKRTPFS